MCGIYGCLNFDNKIVDTKTLNNLSNGMIHRGPDNQGFLIDKNFGFGMRRLSIIDLDGGNQPIFNETKNLSIVFNGEIYNYKEIKDKLIQKGHVFQTEGDTEVIIHLFEEKGIDCVNDLNGEFSFAIWDKIKRQLYIARDRFGVKPLYWYQNNKSFYFSSDLLALNRIIGEKVSKTSILNYLIYSYVPAPQSIFKNIFKLEPGHNLTIKNNKVEKRKYWNLNKKKINKSVIEIKNEIDYLLKDSIKLRLNSDVPLGIMLSGGIDSSTIALYASKELDNISSYTIKYIDKEEKDSISGRFVAEKFKLNHNEYEFFSKNEISSIDEILFKIDEPISDNALIGSYKISKLAHDQKRKVLLSGAGADEIFGGYDRHVRDSIFSSWGFVKLPFYLKWLLNPIVNLFRPGFSLTLKNEARLFFCSISGINLHLLTKISKDSKLFQNVLKKLDEKEKNFKVFNTLKRMQTDLENYLPNNILSLADKASMATSVECRVPFLDHRLVEYCFSLNEKELILDDKKKGLLKSHLTKHFSYDFLERKKEGFNAPTSDWIFKNFEKIINEFKNSPSLTLSEIINFKSLLKHIKTKNKIESYSETIYSLYILNRWLNIHNL